jgi:hypothetical protein
MRRSVNSSRPSSAPPSGSRRRAWPTVWRPTSTTTPASTLRLRRSTCGATPDASGRAASLPCGPGSASRTR